MYNSSSITIIGGGIVGCAIALRLSDNGYTNITVLECNKTIPGLNQSSTNEGSIHSGIYYPKDLMPLKAKLCVEGNALMYKFLKKHKLPYKKVGKLIIATTPQEEEYLDFFLQVGNENDVPGIRKITGKEVKTMEPNIANVIAALYVPSTGCASTAALIKKVKEFAETNGVAFMLGTKVVGIVPSKKRFAIVVETSQGIKTLKTDILINAAGLYSDEIAKMVNSESPYEIDPARGEFYQYNKSLRRDIWMNGMHVYQPPYCYTIENGKIRIMPVPSKELRNKLKEGSVTITAGVHLSPAYDEVNGEYVMNKTTISPLKTTGLGKEDYTTNLHPARDYIQKIHYFFPSLREEDLQPDHTGIMCSLKPQRDFVIEKDKMYPNCINLIGIESPGWTSTFAIAKYVESLMEQKTKRRSH